MALCRRRHLPLPALKARVGDYCVDFLWREQRLIVETDGFRHHGTRSAFESDRERDVRLELLGYAVHRFTHRQIADQSGWVAGSVATLLAARPAGGAAR